MKPKKIVFVYMGATNLGIEYLSAYLKRAGHKTELVFDPALFNDKYWLDIPFFHRVFKKRDGSIVSDITKHSPDFICFSVFTDNYLWACNLAKKIREKTNTPIVFGGIHPTSVPDVVISNSFVDYVIIGEGEEPLLKLVNGTPPDKTPNLVYKQNGKIIKNKLIAPLDIDKLPFPDKELFKKHIGKTHYTIMVSRGCHFKCSYCYANYVNKLYGNKFARMRSIENVMAELRQVKKDKSVKKINFEDDILTRDVGWFREFMKSYNREINLPFRCITHPLYLTDEVGLILSGSACYKLEFGVQTMGENIRKNLLKRYETNEQIIKALEVCQRYGLPFQIDQMVGFKGQTDMILRKTAHLWNKYRPKRITCYWLQYFPKTEIINLMGVGKREVARLENGITTMYINGGSVKGKGKRLFKRYVVLFRALPIIPRPIIKFMLDTNIYKSLSFFPDVLILPIDLLVAIKAKDLKVFNYMRYYIRHMVSG